MSNAAIMWARKQEVGAPVVKFLLVILADYADESWSCFPSQNTLADEIEVSRRTIVRHLKTLEDGGWIRREHRSNEFGFRSSDRFYLNADKMPTCQSDAGDEAENLSDTVDTLGENLSDTTCTPKCHQVHAQVTPVSQEGEPPRTPKNPQGARKGSQFPEGFAFEDVRDWTIKSGNTLNASDFEHFKDYHLSQGSIRKDWPATWRTWCHKSKEYRKPNYHDRSDDRDQWNFG